MARKIEQNLSKEEISILDKAADLLRMSKMDNRGKTLEFISLIIKAIDHIGEEKLLETLSKYSSREQEAVS
ncbi:hypothetical protein D3C84_1289850 [compost metagenome]